MITREGILMITSGGDSDDYLWKVLSSVMITRGGYSYDYDVKVLK